MELGQDGCVGGSRDQEVVKAGPCGNLRCGEAWEELFPGFVDKVFISHGTSIRSMQMVYRMVDGGELVVMNRHGGQGRSFSTIQFQNDEFIQRISGHLSYWLKNVKSLTIVTNLDTHGPYGKEEGTPFAFEVDDGCIRGLHGRSSKSRLNAIGAFIATGIRVRRTEEEQVATPSPPPPLQTTVMPTASTPTPSPPRSPPPPCSSSSKPPVEMEASHTS